MKKYLYHSTKNIFGMFKMQLANIQDQKAVVVAQLVERSLPTPEIRGSNPNSGKVLFTNCN